MSRRPPAKRAIRWAYLTGATAENEVVLELGERRRPEVIGEGVVLASDRIVRDDGTVVGPAFARQAMRTSDPLVASGLQDVADRLAGAITREHSRDRHWRWTLQVVVPDSRDPRDPRRAVAREIDEGIAERLEGRLERSIAESYVEDVLEAERLAQVWVVDEGHVLVGFTAIDDALSRAPAGRLQLDRAKDMPSRAGLKLEEAIEWIGIGPEPGDTVIDLGAGRGGWTSVAARRGAKVTAVDRVPLALAPSKSKVRSVQGSAFDYIPEETADWLLVDVAHRPLDVAKLVAKWGRRVWARQFIANFKLPMKKKIEVLERITRTLEEGGWRGVKARHLYYDRDEVTIYAWLDPRVAVRGFHVPGPGRDRNKNVAPRTPPREPRARPNRKERASPVRRRGD